MSHPTNLHRPRHGRDLVGQRFGRLVVEAQAESARYTQWRCRCDCGGAVVVSRQLLMMGTKGTRSCGCLRREQQRANMTRLHATGRLRTPAAPTPSTAGGELERALRGWGARARVGP